MMEGALLRSVPLTSALRGSKTLKCWRTLKCCSISVPLAAPEPMLTPCTGTGQAGAGAPQLIYGFRPFLGLRVSTGASGQCSSAHRMSPFWERRLGVKQETWVSTLEVEYLTLYPRQLIGVRQARCIKCPAQEKRYTFAERHSHSPLPDPGLCKDLSFWFKHSSNCYQMCMSGPWTHWQPLIGVTSPGPPLPLAWGPSVPAQPAVPAHLGVTHLLTWISALPWTCLIPVNLSALLSSVSCQAWPALLGSCGMGPCPASHGPPVPLCSLTAKRKRSQFPFPTQMGATNLYLTYELVFPYCRGFECFRLDMDKRNETKLKLNIQL